MTFVKSANLALSFFLELCLLAALGYWGFTTGSGVARYLLCLGIPLLAALTWGIFMAPASPRRLHGLAYQVLGLILFGLAILALYTAGQPALALIFWSSMASTRLCSTCGTNDTEFHRPGRVLSHPCRTASTNLCSLKRRDGD